MEELRCTLANCKSGKEVARKIWACTQLKIMVWLCRWWTTRNKANAGERVQAAGEVCNAVQYHLNEFTKLNGPNKTQSQDEQPKWKPPLEEHYKLNVDAAYSTLTRKGGLGLRGKGQYMLCVRYWGRSHPESCKCLAC
jgi:hypothetical protein